MKKKYTQYSMPLLVGLLSFNTLSSCSNTKQELGMGWVDDTVRFVRRNPGKVILFGVATTTASGITGGITGGIIGRSLQPAVPTGVGPTTTPLLNDTTTARIIASLSTPFPWGQNGSDISTGAGTDSTLVTSTENSSSQSNNIIVSSTEKGNASSVSTSTLSPEEEQAPEKLFDAINEEDPHRVQTLIDEKKVNVNAMHNIFGHTPLILAIMKENLGIVRVLLSDNKTDVNATNIESNTPLIAATTKGNVAIVQLL